MASQTHTPDYAAHRHYYIRRRFFSFPHSHFHVYDSDDQQILYARMKGFRLREDLRLYADEGRQQERLAIRTEQIIDFAAAYEVTDVNSGAVIGTLKRRGLRSMLRDEWVMTDPEGTELARIQEDSTLKALVRRLVDAAAFLLPQRYHIEGDGRTLATYQQNLNPIRQRLDVAIIATATGLDPRLILAAGVLLMAIEGRQG